MRQLTKFAKIRGILDKILWDVLLFSFNNNNYHSQKSATCYSFSPFFFLPIELNLYNNYYYITGYSTVPVNCVQMTVFDFFYFSF